MPNLQQNPHDIWHIAAVAYAVNQYIKWHSKTEKDPRNVLLPLGYTGYAAFGDGVSEHKSSEEEPPKEPGDDTPDSDPAHHSTHGR